MASVNKVILVGRLGQDVQVNTTGSGKSVANFSVATEEKYTDGQGVAQKRTDWHAVVAWGKTGQLAFEYLHKGSLVYIEGKLTTRSWDDKDGNKKYKTEVVASNLVFLDSKSTNGEQNQSQSRPAAQDSQQEDLPF
jgi:single-strand DNA-binding protein